MLLPWRTPKSEFHPPHHHKQSCHRKEAGVRITIYAGEVPGNFSWWPTEYSRELSCWPTEYSRELCCPGKQTKIYPRVGTHLEVVLKLASGYGVLSDYAR